MVRHGFRCQPSTSLELCSQSFGIRSLSSKAERLLCHQKKMAIRSPATKRSPLDVTLLLLSFFLQMGQPANQPKSIQNDDHSPACSKACGMCFEQQQETMCTFHILPDSKGSWSLCFSQAPGLKSRVWDRTTSLRRHLSHTQNRSVQKWSTLF